MTSRIKRWTGVGLGDGAGSDASEYPGIDPRIEHALEMALAALELARTKLERGERRRHVLAAVEAMVGLVGLAGLMTMTAETLMQRNLVVVGALSLAAAVPIVGAFARAFASSRRAIEEVAAVETARTVAAQAAGLARTLEVATRPNRADAGSMAVANEVLQHYEQAAAALEGRERRVDVGQGPDARRHVRIRPLDERIAVTTEDGLTIIARLVDVSISGAMIAGELPDVRVGDEIRVGSRAAIVVRIVERGIACEFVEPLPAHSLAPNVVL